MCENGGVPIREGTRIRKIREIVEGKLHPQNKSGVTGVYWDERQKKWGAQITVNGKRTKLGLFERLEDAAQQRKRAEEEYFAPLVQPGEAREAEFKYERRCEFCHKSYRTSDNQGTAYCSTACARAHRAEQDKARWTRRDSRVKMETESPNYDTPEIREGREKYWHNCANGNRSIRVGASGVPGVNWERIRNKWNVHLYTDGKNIYIGRFDRFSDAVDARLRAEKERCGKEYVITGADMNRH